MDPEVPRPIEVKSDIKSKEFREKGNKLYKNSEINDAILFFNMAINFAQSKENLAFAYGNRSAAYLETKKYKECLKNIKWARESGYPADKMEKLDERKEKCLKLMMESLQSKPEEDPWNYVKLSYPANEKIPWMIKDLEMRRTEKYGRGIYATRDLKPGDYVCVENISVAYSMYDRESFYRNCINCHKMKLLNLIPCTKTGK